jgi:8-oxo-dGTP diphosphatase
MFGYREIACSVLVDTRGRFLLQRRDDNRDIIQPGKVSVFGGHREGEETYLQCAVREVLEEISYHVTADRFTHLTSYHGNDLEVEGGRLHAEFYVAEDIPVDKLLVTEGTLLIANMDETMALASQFTPYTGIACKHSWPSRLADGQLWQQAR